jgi:hypothetical protein
MVVCYEEANIITLKEQQTVLAIFPMVSLDIVQFTDIPASKRSDKMNNQHREQSR